MQIHGPILYSIQRGNASTHCAFEWSGWWSPTPKRTISKLSKIMCRHKKTQTFRLGSCVCTFCRSDPTPQEPNIMEHNRHAIEACDCIVPVFRFVYSCFSSWSYLYHTEGKSQPFFAFFQSFFDSGETYNFNRLF